MIAQYAMWAAAVCYSVAACGYALEGKPWMMLTVLLYGVSVVTIWIGGER